MNEILEKGRRLYAYEISGQYDQDDMADEPIDGVWCSIYDVLKLSHFEIIDPIEKEDFDEAYSYLKEAMVHTKNHKNHEFEY